MGVYANANVNFSAISNEMAETTSFWMNGYIQIIDSNTDEQTWNPVTNEYTGGSSTVLWSGPARIQHLKNESMPDIGFSQTSIRGVRFQVPNDESLPFVRKGLQIIVIDGGSDKYLEDLSYVVTSAINSSYAWLRTIEAEVDMKAVANYD